MKSMRYYDFALSANGAAVIQAEGENFRIQSATGALDITVENVGTLPGLLTGQGAKGVPFKRLIIKDASGASNTGSILVSPAEFVDNRTYGVQTISGGTIDLTAASLGTLRQPLASTGNFKSSGALAANTPETVFTPAANVNGAIILTAGFSMGGNATLCNGAFLAKASAPTTNIDGEVLACTIYQNIASTTYIDQGQLPAPQFVAGGLGLYFIIAGAAANGIRHCRYRLL